jgi:hypothetical protein
MIRTAFGVSPMRAITNGTTGGHTEVRYVESPRRCASGTDARFTISSKDGDARPAALLGSCPISCPISRSRCILPRRRKSSEHLKYEGKVDARCEGSPSNCIHRFRYDGPDPSRPRKRTLREVRRARPYYSDLINEVAEHGYNSDIHRITRRQLTRAANAIAISSSGCDGKGLC